MMLNLAMKNTISSVNKYFLVALIALFSLADAQSIDRPTAGEKPAEGLCYLPTESNVAYSEIALLPVASPTEVLDYGDKAYQFGELWLPLDSSLERPSPLVILIHGGCWLNAFDIGHTHALSTALAQAGYAVWSLEYRRTGDKGGGWPGSYQDIKSAIAYLPKLAQYPVDLDKVAIAGHSAGGHLALLAGADAVYDFKAVIGLAAIVDLEQYSLGTNSCQAATAKFMGGSAAELPEAYQVANPAKRKLAKSTVLLHGTQDAIVPIAHAKQANMRHRIVDGAGHFDMVHPGTPAFQTLLQELARAFAEGGS